MIFCYDTLELCVMIINCGSFNCFSLCLTVPTSCGDPTELVCDFFALVGMGLYLFAIFGGIRYIIFSSYLLLPACNVRTLIDHVCADLLFST